MKRTSRAVRREVTKSVDRVAAAWSDAARWLPCTPVRDLSPLVWTTIPPMFIGYLTVDEHNKNKAPKYVIHTEFSETNSWYFLLWNIIFERTHAILKKGDGSDRQFTAKLSLAFWTVWAATVTGSVTPPQHRRTGSSVDLGDLCAGVHRTYFLLLESLANLRPQSNALPDLVLHVPWPGGSHTVEKEVGQRQFDIGFHGWT